MALIKCGECGKKFSNNAPACPNCGNPASSPGNKKQIMGCSPTFLAIIGAFALLAFIVGRGGEKPDTARVSAQHAEPVKVTEAPPATQVQAEQTAALSDNIDWDALRAEALSQLNQDNTNIICDQIDGGEDTFGARCIVRNSFINTFQGKAGHSDYSSLGEQLGWTYAYTMLNLLKKRGQVFKPYHITGVAFVTQPKKDEDGDLISIGLGRINIVAGKSTEWEKLGPDDEYIIDTDPFENVK